MNKLSIKFISGITLILLVTIGISLYINSSLIERYYIHEKKAALDEICNQLEQAIEEGTDEKSIISSLEEAEEITIVRVDKTTNFDELNEELRVALRGKGIGFKKFWLWEQDYYSAIENGRKLRIYNQGKLNYSLMVEYIGREESLYAVAMIIPHVTDAIGIVNTVTTFVMLFALLVAIGLVIILVKRITQPLDRIKQFVDDIAAQKYHPLEINTHDELEAVATSMNRMCADIETYQNELINKNREMSELLDNVTHDLKTPVALIKAYSNGIKDGLDDGTFLDTIIHQNNRMSDMIENLLFLSRMKKREVKTDTVALDSMLTKLIEEQAIITKMNDNIFQINIVPHALIQSNAEIVMIILVNLLSNALKYSSGKIIKISLTAVEEGYLFEITNQTDTTLDTTRLWEPFYVGEASRNKDLSGTGLGLTLVKRSAQKIGASASCHMEDGKITFQVLFKNTMKV